MIYCFDIDGTLCTNTEGDYEAAEPFPHAIEQVNALAAAGHRIILCTARGSTTGIDWRSLTERQMEEWGVVYHELHLGKPTADVYVDDKGMHVEAWHAMRGQPFAPISGEVVALVPARSGSKGVPGKNVHPLAGHPLLSWSVAAAQQSQLVDRVIVSTDSEEYAAIARSYGAETPFIRPAELAADHVGDLEVVRHTCEWLAAHENKLPELIVFLRPTTPLRDPNQIDAAVRALRASPRATSLRSAHQLAEPIQKMMGEKDGFLTELFPQCSHLPRQNFPASFHPNGYVDVARTLYVQSGYDLYGPRILAWETEEACEVDRAEDLERLEYQVHRGRSHLLGHLDGWLSTGRAKTAAPAFAFSRQPTPTTPIHTEHRRIQTALPVAEDIELLDRLAHVESRSMHGQIPVVWDRARGHAVGDRWGNQWIDFTSTIFVANTGHADPNIVRAVHDVLEQGLVHTYTYASEVRADYLERLIAATPAPLEKAFLLSAGTEATECALKLMRLHGRAQRKRRLGVVSFEGAMHGRTLGAQMLGGTAEGRSWIGYDDPNIHRLPFPHPGEADGRAMAREHIGMLLDRGLDPDRDLCGILLESYVGWGAIFFDPNYVQEMADFARGHDLLLGFDEIQAGFGRTGRMFAYEHYGVEPDLVLCGKAMSGGIPLSAVLGRREIMDLPPFGSMSSTHSANPVACAAGLAVLDSLTELDLIRESERKGAILHGELTRIAARFPEVSAVHGRGMVAALILADPETGAPLDHDASQVCETAMRAGLLLVHTGRESIKIGPPLTISDSALKEGLGVLEEALAQVLQPQLVPDRGA